MQGPRIILGDIAVCNCPLCRKNSQLRLERAEAVVVPLRIGRRDADERPRSLAMGRAAVTSHLTAESLPIVARSDILKQEMASGMRRAGGVFLWDSALQDRIDRTERERVNCGHWRHEEAYRMGEILGPVRG